MAVEWSEAPKTVIDIAQRIIAKHHPKLADARIAFIMRSEAPVTNGRATLGKAKKVSAELQVHLDYDFVIWLAKDEWLGLNAVQREALIDHELSHCFWDGLTASMKGHDVEEFSHIIERYGFWWPHSKPFEKAVQHALPLVTSMPREGTVGTIDFGRIAKDAESAMRAEGLDVEVTHFPATRGQ
jgi:hypothetical protein